MKEKGQTRSHQQIIAEEWMIDTRDPSHSVTRLKRRSTYSDITLWWLVMQLDLLEAQSFGLSDSADPRQGWGQQAS